MFTKDPVKLNKKKSIKNATDFTKKVREHTLELLALKFELEKTMAQVVPEDFGELKYDAWQRFESELTDYLSEIKDEV